MSQLALLLSLALASWLAVAQAASVSFGSAVPQCPNPLDRQFVVSVATKEPLGLRLSDKLEILEFLRDGQGRMRAVEASGHAQLRDRLITVNNESLIGLPFQSALAALARAVLPRELRFETGDGRCMVAASEDHANTTSANSARYDYVVLNMGYRDIDQAFYAVLSAAGQPPSCLFREVVVADPLDACDTLTVNATDRYVLVTNVLACPMHQKAAFVQEAGARGAVFVQREGEKLQQLKLPSDLPKPISLPLVMVSFASGWQLYDSLVNRARPTQSPLLRFVFSEACTADKFAVHPDDDPLQLSVVNRAGSASAGFLSLTVAESAAKTISGTAFEFLKPLPIDQRGTTPDLPLGTSPLLVLTAAQLDPCESAVERQPPEFVTWASAVEGTFVLVRLDETKCTVATQVAFFTAYKAIGVVFADGSFPTAANLEGTRTAAQQATIPFVFISPTSLQNAAAFSQAEEANHVLVEFAGENALRHQWEDLRLASNVENWPTTERARERLFYRMLKDQQALGTDESEHNLVVNERYDTLEASFEKARRFYEHQERDDAIS